MLLAVTTQAVRIRILPWHGFEADDLADVPTSLDVRGTGTVARLASMTIVQSSLEVRSPLELVRV